MKHDWTSTIFPPPCCFNLNVIKDTFLGPLVARPIQGPSHETHPWEIFGTPGFTTQAENARCLFCPQYTECIQLVETLCLLGWTHTFNIYSYWTLPFVVDQPIKHVDFSIAILVCQSVVVDQVFPICGAGCEIRHCWLMGNIPFVSLIIYRVS